MSSEYRSIRDRNSYWAAGASTVPATEVEKRFRKWELR